MGFITKPKTYNDNDPILYSDLNANWDTLYNLVNGNIDNSNIASGAAIDPLKISGGAVTLNSVQTIAGQKTLIKPILNGVQNVTNDTWGATVNLDMSQSNVHLITLAGNTILAVQNVSPGQFFQVELVQDSTGSRLVTWFAGITWVGGNVTPTLTTIAGKKDTFVFRCTGPNTYDGYIAGLNVG